MNYDPIITDPINIYGLDYRGADAVMPAGSSGGEVKLRALCYNRAGAKLDAFLDWKAGTRALVTGYIVFSDDTSQPLDLMVTTIEFNIPQDMYCNQVVLGNAFFGSDEIKERKNGQVAIKIGTTLDNADTTTWLFMETHESRKRNSLIESAKGEAFASMATCVSIAKKGTRALTVQSLRLTSLLVKKENELNELARQAKQRATGRQTSTQSPDY